MSDFDMDNTVNEIARAVHGNTNDAIKGAIEGTGLTRGTITETGLLLDGFKHEFKDYEVLDYLKLEDSYTTESAGDSSHIHKIKTPTNLTKLKVKDRVLVAQFGADNVVIGRVVPHA